MLKLKLIPLLILCTLIGQGQSKGDSLMQAFKIKEAIKSYELELSQDSTMRTYNYACALALDNQKDKAFDMLNKALKFDTTIYPMTDADLYFLIEDGRWDSLANEQLKKVSEKYNKEYEFPELTVELWKIQLKDQAFYKHLESQENGSIINKALWELKGKINQENHRRVSEIIEKYGWPKKSVFGYTAASSVFLVIQHSDFETQEKYIPLMKEAAEEGEAEWSSYAMLEDRYNLGKGLPQNYGTQIGMDDEGNMYVMDLFEPEYVNQRRKKVGLGPLEEYTKLFGFEWTVRQKEK